MKPFFGTDVTNDKNNEVINGDEFAIANADTEQTEAFDFKVDTAEQIIEQSKLPLRVRIIEWVCGIIAAIGVAAISGAIGDEDGVTLAKAYSNAPWLFWLTGLCAITFGVLFFLGLQKAKAVLESDEADEVGTALDNISDKIFLDFGAPEDAADVDVMLFNYKIKDGEPIFKTTGLSSNHCIFVEMKAFVKDDQLCLATVENDSTLAVVIRKVGSESNGGTLLTCLAA